MEKNEWLGVIAVIAVVGLIAGAIGAGITAPIAACFPATSSRIT